jgi:hypothetical protein
MTDDSRSLSDADLDRMLAGMARGVPEPSEALMARVLSDAMDARPAPGGSRQAGVLATILSAIGGWKGAGGLVTAGLVGLWVGIAPPSALSSEAQTLWNAVSPDVTGGWADYGDSL